MNIKDLKQGQNFSFKPSRGPRERGSIYIDKPARKVYFCTNDPALEGSKSPYKWDYKYSWVATIEKNGEILLGRELNLLKTVRTISPADTIAGWAYEVKGSNIIFGCGAVKLSKKEISTFLKIRSILEYRNNSIDLTQEDLNTLNIIL